MVADDADLHGGFGEAAQEGQQDGQQEGRIGVTQGAGWHTDRVNPGRRFWERGTRRHRRG
jgi:hypothetical protein